MQSTAITPHTARTLVRAFSVVAALLVLPATVRAQDANKVYDLSEVDVMPKLMSQQYFARIMQDAYPASLRKAGIGGAVQMEFVVNASGKVDASTIDAMSNVPALLEAAKGLAPKLEFQPAKVKGTAVKSRVILPLVFKP